MVIGIPFGMKFFFHQIANNNNVIGLLKGILLAERIPMPLLRHGVALLGEQMMVGSLQQTIGKEGTFLYIRRLNKRFLK